MPGFAVLPGTNYFRVMERAREIDPDAFKGVQLTHYQDDQLVRQEVAYEKARKEFEQSDPPNTQAE